MAKPILPLSSSAAAAAPSEAAEQLDLTMPGAVGGINSGIAEATAELNLGAAQAEANIMARVEARAQELRKRRYLGRYFTHPMMQNRRAKRDDYKPSAALVTGHYVP
ncbi:hypothetical protein [Piscirickettsia salmonis]|uniref:hypothetical protein n=1 Tax=Piscirickettsia salmonis TaxID=1238 RepID=UPI0007C8A420|nr:hypothetical protein A0O36_02581 [Piscirickettsiaceae bacterium NZ-RLO1]